MRKEHINPVPDKWLNAKKDAGRYVDAILKARGKNKDSLDPKLIDIVTSVAADAKTLLEPSDILKRASEIDNWDDPISKLHHDTYEPLMNIYHGKYGKKSPSILGESIKRCTVWELKNRLLARELTIMVAQQFYPTSTTPKEAFGSIQEENAETLYRFVRAQAMGLSLRNYKPTITLKNIGINSSLNEPYL